MSRRRAVRRRGSRATLAEVAPPVHIIGPALTMPSDRPTSDALFYWLDDLGLFGDRPGQASIFSLLLTDAATWDEFVEEEIADGKERAARAAARRRAGLPDEPHPLDDDLDHETGDHP